MSGPLRFISSFHFKSNLTVHLPSSSSVAARRKTQTVENKSAWIIQTYWRKNFSKRTTAKLIQHLWEGVGFTATHVPDISFEALVVFLREKPVIAAMKDVLQRIHLQSTFRHGSPSKSLRPENVNVRVFLAAYMIAYRSSHVFESMAALEQALFETSVPLLNMFHTICSRIMESPHKCFQEVPSALTKEFPTTLFEYLKRFKAWKVPDEAKLTARIKHALFALHHAESHLPADEPEDSKLKVEFRCQIARLREKLQQIAGKAALEQLDRELAERCLNPSSGGGGDGGSNGGAYAALPGRITNEHLAHNLLLNPDFTLDEHGGCDSENPVYHRIRESFHRAFWDSLVDDLNLPTPCYVRVLRVLAEIRDGIADLTGSRENNNNISEIIDTDFIKTRVESGAFAFVDAAGLMRSVVGVITRVQSPKRDEETKTAWAPLDSRIATATIHDGSRVLCDCLEFLLNRVNAMRIDAANAR